MSRSDHPSILIIGGGIAGAACAIELRRREIAVDVVEKEAFPRPKVCGCCIGGTGLAMLEQLGLRRAAIEAGVATRRWSGSLAGRTVDLDMPTGLAISRETLDPMLLRRAIELGADVRMQTEATVDGATPQFVSVRVTNLPSQQYDIVIVAAGLRAGGVQSILPWTKTPQGPFGVSMTAKCESVAAGVIYMACGDDGYVGMVKLADGRVDVAGALASGAVASGGGSPMQRLERLLAQSSFGFAALEDVSPIMTTPPLRRARRSGNGRLIAIGDAAGYVEPFTGEGMTWAMQSGIAAAETIVENLRQPESIGSAWQVRSDKLLRKKRRTCRWVTTALRSPLTRRVAATVLIEMPALAAPLIRSLNRSQ